MYYTLRRADYLKAANFVNTKKHEIGGIVHVDCIGHSLYFDPKINSGQFNTIYIPKAYGNWHTHPNTCQKGRCIVGVPSYLDIVSFLEQAKQKALFHIIFSKEGSYVLTLNSPLPPNKYHFQQAKTTKKHFYNLLSKLELGYITQDDFNHKWIKLADHIGVHIIFMPHPMTPSVPIPDRAALCK